MHYGLFIRYTCCTRWQKEGQPHAHQTEPHPLHTAWQEEAAKTPGALLEDYVTALYADGDFLWLGFREKGVQKLRLRDMAPVDDKDAESFNAAKDARHRWVRKFVRLSDGSLYFYNPNGHENRNGWRDFHIELRRAAEAFRGEVPESTRTSPVLARTRVHDFAGSGCWKHFVVQGPAQYAVRVGGNNSFNTILNGVFLSAMDEKPGSYKPLPVWAFPDSTRDPGDSRPVSRPDSLSGSLLSCWRAFVHPEQLEPAKMPLSRRSGPLAWCNLAARPDAASYAALKSVWERRLLFWPADSLPAFDKAMLEAWDRVQDTYAYARSAEWRPYSPNVVPLSLQELKYAQWNRIPWRPYAKGSKVQPAIPIAAYCLKKTVTENLAHISLCSFSYFFCFVG